MSNCKTFWLAFLGCTLSLSILEEAQSQQLIGTYPTDGGSLSVSAVGGDVRVLAMEIVSPSGGLLPAVGPIVDPAVDPDGLLGRFPSADPFSFFVRNGPTRAVPTTFGVDVLFSPGETTELTFGVAANTNDVVGAWGGGSPVPFPIAAVDVPPDSGQLFGTFDIQGGFVSLAAIAGDVTITELRFQSPGGNLIPANQEAFDTSPFNSLLANDPNQITLGLDEPMLFAEGTLTQLPFAANGFASDITGTWINGDETIDFPVATSFYGDPSRTDPPVEPPVIDPPSMNNDDNLLGGGEMGAGNGSNTGNGMGAGSPQAVPEPTSLVIWIVLGLMASYKSWISNRVSD